MELRVTLTFLLPVYKLLRYHRLIFDNVADGAFRSTHLPWIEGITHVKAEEKEEMERERQSNYMVDDSNPQAPLP
jgi:hypothetical protein